MARTANTLERAVMLMEDALLDKPFQVDGFLFNLDAPNLFDPYKKEPMKLTGFWDDDAPAVEGFVYVSDEYIAFVEALIESDSQHPGNFNNLPWTILGGHTVQHHSTPSFDTIDTIAIPTPQLIPQAI